MDKHGCLYLAVLYTLATLFVFVIVGDVASMRQKAISIFLPKAAGNGMGGRR